MLEFVDYNPAEKEKMTNRRRQRMKKKSSLEVWEKENGFYKEVGGDIEQ